MTGPSFPIPGPSFSGPVAGDPMASQGNKRNRTHSQGPNQGRRLGANGMPGPGFPKSAVGDPTAMPGNTRHERNRTLSQGNRGQRPVVNFDQRMPDPELSNPGFGDPRSMQQNGPRERRRTHSQGQRPRFDINQGVPHPGFANSGIRDPNGMKAGIHFAQETPSHHRSRTHSRGHDQEYERERGRDHSRSHNHHNSHSHGRPHGRSSLARPFITTTTHVKPLPIHSFPTQQARQQVPPPRMPPPEPRQIRTHNMPGAGHVFQYSRCTGRKKALCVCLSTQSILQFF